MRKIRKGLRSDREFVPYRRLHLPIPIAGISDQPGKGFNRTPNPDKPPPEPKPLKRKRHRKRKKKAPKAMRRAFGTRDYYAWATRRDVTECRGSR